MSQFNQTKIEKKRRQGQKKPDGKTATPKPVCPKCGEILKRTYTREPGKGGKRGFKGSGWSCPSSTCDYIIKDFVEIENTEEENEKLRNRLDIMWNEAHETKLPHPNSEKSWYDLAEIMEKDREIETLKKILEFSREDKQEWKKHKEIFNFMVKKMAKLKERIKELEAVRD